MEKSTQCTPASRAAGARLSSLSHHSCLIINDDYSVIRFSHAAALIIITRDTLIAGPPGRPECDVKINLFGPCLPLLAKLR